MVLKSKWWLPAGLLPVLWILPAGAQEPDAPSAAGLAAEMSAMNRSLERVAAVLEQVLEQQKTDLVLKRIEMRERRLAPLEDELRRRQSERMSRKAEMERLEAMKEDMVDRLREAARTDEAAANELREMQAQYDQALAGEAAQQKALEERVRSLEDELAEGREQIKDLEALLLERLGE